MKYLLDTNICIYLIKKRPEKVLARLSTISLGNVALASVTVAELKYGVEKSAHPDQNQKALNQFLLPFEILNFDFEAAQISGEIRAHLEKKGSPIGAYDLLIAAQALKDNRVLVTNNTREFQRIEGLVLENWTL